MTKNSKNKHKKGDAFFRESIKTVLFFLLIWYFNRVKDIKAVQSGGNFINLMVSLQ